MLCTLPSMNRRYWLDDGRSRLDSAEDLAERAVHLVAPGGGRVVPLALVTHLGQVHRGLHGDRAHVGRADVGEQEVLRVVRAAPAPTGAGAVPGEAPPAGGLRVPLEVARVREMPAQPLPRLVALVGALGREHLDTHATLVGPVQRPGDRPVVERPRGDPDPAVGRQRRPVGAARATPGALDGVQDPLADGDLLLLATVRVAEHRARVGGQVHARLADGPRGAGVHAGAPLGEIVLGLTEPVRAVAAAGRGPAGTSPRRATVHARTISTARVAERRINSMGPPQWCVALSEPQPIDESRERNTREPPDSALRFARHAGSSTRASGTRPTPADPSPDREPAPDRPVRSAT